MAKTKQAKLKTEPLSGSLATRHGVRPLNQIHPRTVSLVLTLLADSLTLTKPRSKGLAATARTSLAALIRELHATEHRVRDLKTAHEKELADL